MIVTEGFSLADEQKRLECLRCGHIEDPKVEARLRPPAAAVIVGKHRRTVLYQ